jgi:MFS transporter, MHS family, proline/betaine transporter
MKHSLSLRIIIASSIGTILEWYDFSLFAFLTPLLANSFFPQDNPFTALMLAYAVFAIGFFVRPIGAAIFGHLGDRIGRKKALIYSIFLMTIPTVLIGFLPTYQSIGIFAPILLIILRICQGLSAGGESAGAILFVLESNDYKYRGFVGALLWAVVGIGLLLGSVAASIATAYSDYPWAWRVPFILGIFTGVIGYFLRKRTPESTQFRQAFEKGILVKFPLYDALKKYKLNMLRIIGVYSLSGMITYLIFIFMNTYAANVIGLPLNHVTWISTLGLTAVTFLVPLGGYLSDLVGRKNILFYFALCFFLLSYPLFLLIATGSIHHFIIAESVFVLLAACYQGTINAFVYEQVPTAVRYSIIAVGYNVAYSIFGGTAPIIASYLVNMTGNKASPGLYLMFGAILAMWAARR